MLPLPSTRLLLLGLATAWASVALPAADTPVIGAPDVPPVLAPGSKAPDLPNDALFAGFVPHLQLTITPENIAKLLQDPRTLVPMTMKEVGGAMRLKINQDQDMLQATTTISNKLGLHARASAKLTKTARGFRFAPIR